MVTNWKVRNKLKIITTFFCKAPCTLEPFGGGWVAKTYLGVQLGPKLNNIDIVSLQMLEE